MAVNNGQRKISLAIFPLKNTTPKRASFADFHELKDENPPSLANTLVVVSWGERRHNPFLWIVNQTLASASSGVSRPINRSAIYRQETTTCVRQALARCFLSNGCLLSLTPGPRITFGCLREKTSFIKRKSARCGNAPQSSNKDTLD